MYKKIFSCFLLSLYLLAGCSDQKLIEDLSFPLVLGMDLDEQQHLHVYMMNPIFNGQSPKKEEIKHVKSFTMRSSPEKLDQQFMGMINGSKIQIILVGNNLLKKKKWITYLDTFYRDPSTNMNTRIIAVDGSVAKVFQYAAKYKGRFPLYLVKLTNTAFKRNTTISTTLHDLYNQTFEKGITPSMGQIKVSRKLQVHGSILLDHTSKKLMSITPLETKLLHILQNQNQGHYIFNVPLNSKNRVGFYTQNITVNTKVTYNKKYIFNTNISMNIIIAEFSPQFSLSKSTSSLEKQLQKQMNLQFKMFVNKIQKSQLDPIGYGIYAKAYTYPQWSKSVSDWGKVYAEAENHISTHIKIIDTGNIK